MVLTTARLSTSVRHVSWVDYCIKASEDLRGPSIVSGNGHGAFDHLTESCLNDVSKFKAHVDDNPCFNFMLLNDAARGEAARQRQLATPEA